MTTPSHEILVQAILENDSALPKDRSINTFHFNTHTGAAPTTAALDEIAVAVRDFYEVAHTGSTNSIASLLGAQLSGVMELKMYDLEDAKPRAPIRDSFPVPFTPGSTALPSEVAVVGSYQAAKLSGFNQRNRRGRIYIGPLSTSTQVSTTGKPVTTANGIVETIASAMTWLAGGTWATLGQTWDVFSQKFNTSAVVTDGWVDNAFDTQRRRGEAATTRRLWT
jgi:hypothetical protein